MRSIGAVSIAWLLLLSPITKTAAQDVLRIAAIVNDEIVSGYDVEQRIQLIVVSSRLPDNSETRRRLRNRVLRSLVDERLQLQEANRLNVKVSLHKSHSIRDHLRSRLHLGH